MPAIHLRSSASICGLLSLFVTIGGQAQREPVLQQIKVPHPYYYREMYLPQVTSGPSAVAWSPDGQELVYSMQGTLWRQRRRDQGGDAAHRRPGLRLPARLVARRSPHRLRLAMRTRRSSCGCSISRTARAEPRWRRTAPSTSSRAGRPTAARIAFVSTLYEGRWHVYRADRHGRVPPGRPSASPRPRQRPAALLLQPLRSLPLAHLVARRQGAADLVSNRGHIWGTGGFWRMPADAGGARCALVHDEETTWKARPDWSPRRAAGGLQLLPRPPVAPALADDRRRRRSRSSSPTATSTPRPRWSPDGARIAYISNEGGNTSLWILDGPRRTADAWSTRERAPYLDPRGTPAAHRASTRASGRPSRRGSP